MRLINWFVEIETVLQRLSLQYWRYSLALFLIFSTLYFQEFAHYLLRVDEEIAAFRLPGEGVIWIAMGRWGVTLVEQFSLRALNPYFAMLFSTILFVLSFLILCKAVRVKLTALVIVSFVFFAGFPIWFYLIEFKGTILANSMAVFLAVVAAAIYVSETRWSRWLFVIVSVFAVSIYQSAILIALTVVVASLIARRSMLPITSMLASILWSLALAVIALGIYGIVSDALMRFFGIEPHYVSGYLRIDQLVEAPFETLGVSLSEAMKLYSGTSRLFLGDFWPIGWLFMLGLLALFVHEGVLKHWRRTILALFLPLLILMSLPFAINVITGGILPFRVLVAVPFVYWFVVIGALQHRHPVIRLVAKALGLAVAIQFYQVSSLASFSHQFVAANDKLVASQVFQRVVDRVGDFDRDRVYVVEFAGPLPFANAPGFPSAGGVTGSSVFEWDSGNPERIIRYLQLGGFANFDLVGPRRRLEIIDAVEAMPAWPAEGSVDIVNGVVVVKFGEYPEWVLSASGVQ